MSKVEVLVAAMHQKDFSLYQKMNLQTDAVIANQSEEYSYKEEIINGNRIKLVSTCDRGVGKNRNMALLNSQAEILLFSDEDAEYFDGYEQIVTEAFDNMPKADMLMFNIEFYDKSKRSVSKISRVSHLNFSRYGTPRIAVRRESLEKANVFFSLLFGGGAKYSAGEDNLFVKECLNKKMKVYAYPKFILKITERESTWFKGFNEKYFFDKGVLFKYISPKFCKLTAIYHIIKHRKKYKEFGIKKSIKIIINGINSVK